jgi:integrase
VRPKPGAKAVITVLRLTEGSYVPKLTNKLPSYRLHKPSGRAVVTIAGKVVYLGKFGSPESRDEYQRVVGEWLTRVRRNLPPDPRSSPSVAEVMVAYWRHVTTYYVKDGRPTSEVDNIRQALRFVRKPYGARSAAEFGPAALKAVRQAMVDHGLCRAYVNRQVNRVRRMFKWAVESELVPVTVYQALAAVAGLAKGRSEAREKPPVGPVPDADVEAVLRHVNPVVAAMVRLQRLTGMRPQEVTLLRPVDVDRTDPACWSYRPHRHKSQHHERERVIFLGPRAQAVLAPWLDREPDAYCFSPAEAVAARNAKRRAERRSPMTPSQASRRPKPDAKRRPGRRYTKDSYRVAIQRACEAAGVDVWAPNQLRHSQATELRKRFGIEGASVVLGHSELGVTQVYAERDLARAREIMAEAA